MNVKKEKFRTYEEIALDTLREIQPATQREWAEALGYNTPQAFHYTFKKIRERLEIISSRPAKYKVKE